MKAILIADDHEIVRKGLKIIIERHSKEYSIIETDSCIGVIQALKQKPAFVILDMYLQDGNIMSYIQHIVNASLDTKILIYSMNSEKIYARRFLQKGIRGYVSKRSSITELEEAISKFLNGEMYLSQELRESLFLSGSKEEPGGNPIEYLSDRELEVAEYTISGLGTKEIAKLMHLEVSTVSTYRRRAYEKLDVDNLIDLSKKISLYKENNY